MSHSDNGAHCETEPKPEPDVDENAKHGGKKRIHPSPLQFLTNNRPNKFLTDNREGSKRTSLQSSNNGIGSLFQTGSLFGARLRQPDEYFVLVGRTVLLHDTFANSAANRATHRILGDRNVELDDDNRATGEIDAERKAALHDDRTSTDQNDQRRQPYSRPAPFEKIEIRILKDGHTRLSAGILLQGLPLRLRAITRPILDAQTRLPTASQDRLEDRTGHKHRREHI